MDVYSILTFTVIMGALAALPSASVALVVTRAATLGVRDGAATAAGIVLGDLLFVLLAVLGMTALAETMGAFFALCRYGGAAYLIWLGIGLLRARRSMALAAADGRRSTVLASVAAGFFLTLGDVKAILFYASLLPTVVDLRSTTGADVAAIMLVTVVTVGGVKLGYALLARRIVARLSGRGPHRRARQLAGGLLIGTGIWVIAKT